MRSFTASAATEGAVCGRGGLFPVARSVSATTIAMDSIQPRMNIAPFRVPRSEPSTRVNAVSGMGSSVIASAIGSSSKIMRAHRL